MDDNKLIEFATREKEDWLMWDISGRLDRTTAGEAAAEGEKLLKTTGKLMMNLKNLEYISSAGCGQFLALRRKRIRRGRFFLYALPPEWSSWY